VSARDHSDGSERIGVKARGFPRIRLSAAEDDVL